MRSSAAGPALRRRLLLGLAMAAASAHTVQASPQLASDMGCFNCHGNPPKKKAPSFAALATQYAKARGDEAAQARLAAKLRDGSIFGHVDAHERLSPDAARQLVHWISEGAR